MGVPWGQRAEQARAVPHAAVAQRISDVADVVGLGLLVALAIFLVHRAATVTPPAWRAFGFVWVGGVVLCANLIVLVSAGLEVVSFDEAYGLWLEIVAGVVPIAMVLSLFVSRVAEDRLVRLVVDLEAGERGPAAPHLVAVRPRRPEPRPRVPDPRRRVDPRRRPTGARRIGPHGRRAGRDASRVPRRADRGHRPRSGAPLRNPERLATAAAAAGLAIDNERLQAGFRARLVDVQASRARIVEAGDRERRRVERNLHDGAQQRLVGLAVARSASLSARPQVTRRWPSPPADAAGDLDDACEELRELAQGIQQWIRRRPRRCAGGPRRTTWRACRAIDRPPRAPPRARRNRRVLNVVSEALANANKYARAGRVLVRAMVTDDVLHLVVADDGGGGAAARTGSGLEGLADRVSVLAGTFDVDSPPGQGTTLTAELPLRSSVCTPERTCSHPGPRSAGGGAFTRR